MLRVPRLRAAPHAFAASVAAPSFRLSVSWLTAGGGQYCVIWAVLFNLLVPQRGFGESEAMLGMYGA